MSFYLWQLDVALTKRFLVVNEKLELGTLLFDTLNKEFIGSQQTIVT